MKLKIRYSSTQSEGDQWSLLDTFKFLPIGREADLCKMLILFLLSSIIVTTSEIVSLLPSSNNKISNNTKSNNKTTQNVSPILSYYPLSIGGANTRSENIRTLLEWLEHHGSYFPKVGVSAATSTGAGGFAIANISRNEKFIKVPQDLIITPTFAARQVPALRALQKQWTVSTLDEAYNKDKVMIAFYLLFEVRRSGGFQQCSFFQPYLDSCPLHYNDFPLFWNKKDVDLLQASRLAHDIRNMKARHLRDFERACVIFNNLLFEDQRNNLNCDDILLESPKLQREQYERDHHDSSSSKSKTPTILPPFMMNPPQPPIRFKEVIVNGIKQKESINPTSTSRRVVIGNRNYTGTSTNQCGGWESWGERSMWSVFEWYMWARTVISSRSWRVYLRGKAPTDKTGQAPQCSYSSLALVPLADLLNHRNVPGTHWTFDETTKSFVVKATKKLSNGGPIYDSYGLKKNSVFLLNFGFVSDNSPHEASLIYPPLDVRKIITTYQRKGINTNEINARFNTIVVDAMESLDQVRKSEWKYEHRRHTVTLTLDDHAHNMLLQLKNVAPKLVGTPPHGWVGRAIMSVASSSLELYDTNLRQDQELLDRLDVRTGLPYLTHWQRNAVKIRMGEKKILKSWLRFGHVVNHNFNIRPHRITVAITTDPTKASALHVHASTLKSLDHMESQDMYVGMPVFAQWGNEFYDGAIVAKFVKEVNKKEKNKKEKTKTTTTTATASQSNARSKDTYLVQFYDGDFKMSTPRDTIVTFPESYLSSKEYETAVRTSAVEIPKALSGVCLIVTSGYWTYEICVGHQIIQYHANPDGTRGNIILLGKYVDVSSIVLNCNDNDKVKDASYTYSRSSSQKVSILNKICTETTNTYESNHRERSIYFEEDNNRSDEDDSSSSSSGSSSSGSSSSGSSSNSYKQEKSNDDNDDDQDDQINHNSLLFHSSSSAAHGRHAYRQMFRDGHDGRRSEVVFVCRREQDPIVKHKALHGESHSLTDLKGSPLRGHKIVRKVLHEDGNIRTIPWTELSTGQILHIDEPELLSYRIVIGTEAACVGLRKTGSKLVSTIQTIDKKSHIKWQKQQRIVPTSASASASAAASASASTLVGSTSSETEAILRSTSEEMDPLMYEHLKGHVMAVMTTAKGRQTWAKADIKEAKKDGTYKVSFDEHNMERENVPLTEIYPIPKALMKLPCWLFEDIPGEGC